MKDGEKEKEKEKEGRERECRAMYECPVVSKDHAKITMTEGGGVCLSSLSFLSCLSFISSTRRSTSLPLALHLIFIFYCDR